MHPIPVDSVVVIKNWVVDNSEILNETTSRVDAWIGQRPQSQLTPKSTSKTESLPTRKSPQLLPQLTLGFVYAHSPCCLSNRHWKLSSWRLKNNKRDCLFSWCLDWSAHTIPVDSEIDTNNESLPTQKSSLKLLPQLTLVSSVRTVSVDSVIITENRVADDSEIINETASTVEA